MNPTIRPDCDATHRWDAHFARKPNKHGESLAKIWRDTVRRPDLLPALLIHLAASSGSLVSLRPIAQALAADEKTVRAYVRLLELLHLIVSVPAWAPGLAGRAVHKPRLFIEDAGLTMAADA